ncbi:MAG: alpha/beta hydrolase [Lachnospiraceae bacterium]|nr:alpha/beta hydrolase [Lachnospiraceae bacterium]
MSTVTNYTFLSTDDQKTPIHAVKWLPDSDPVAVMQLTHGMREYIERYSEFAEFLADKGFAVFGHDHIGHGDSVSSPSQRGIMHSDAPDRTMVEDMFTQYALIKEQYPNLPYFILGHSMGSYLLREFLFVKAAKLNGVSGAIIVGTGTENNAAIIAGNILCKLLMIFKGKDSTSDFINSLMFGGDYKQFDTTGTDPSNSWLSKNSENVTRVYASKKCGYEFSLNGYMVLLRSTLFDNKMSNIRRMNMNIPIFFASGDHDPVGQMGTGVVKAHEKFKEAGVCDLSIKLYEGDRHEILNELDRATVYDDLYKWMKDRF